MIMGGGGMGVNGRTGTGAGVGTAAIGVSLDRALGAVALATGSAEGTTWGLTKPFEKASLEAVGLGVGAWLAMSSA